MASLTILNSVESFTLVNQVPPAHKFVYAVKFICNPTLPSNADRIGLVRGQYATDINVHNPSFQKQNATITKKFVIAVPEPNSQGTAVGQLPFVPATPSPYIVVSVILGPDAAIRIDCNEIYNLLSTPGNLCPNPNALTCDAVKGFVIIYSNVRLDVVAEYTAGTVNPAGTTTTCPTAEGCAGISVDVQYIQPQFFTP